jgi:hypothetical protein
MELSAAFAIPGDLACLTGGYAYDREVLARIDGLRHLPLPQGFPFPSLEVLAESATRLSAVRSDEILLCDGLAFGVLPEQVLKQISAPIVALVHHPLALETGLSAEVAQDLAVRECKALSFARRVIVTSPITRDLLVRDYAVDAACITVALPGTQRASRAQSALALLQSWRVRDAPQSHGFRRHCRGQKTRIHSQGSPEKSCRR